MQKRWNEITKIKKANKYQSSESQNGKDLTTLVPKTN